MTRKAGTDGIFLAVFDIARLRDVEAFGASVSDFISYLKETPTAAGFDEILYPGELEARFRARRICEGIELDDTAWEALSALKVKLGV